MKKGEYGLVEITLGCGGAGRDHITALAGDLAAHTPVCNSSSRQSDALFLCTDIHSDRTSIYMK